MQGPAAFCSELLELRRRRVDALAHCPIQLDAELGDRGLLLLVLRGEAVGVGGDPGLDLRDQPVLFVLHARQLRLEVARTRSRSSVYVSEALFDSLLGLEESHRELGSGLPLPLCELATSLFGEPSRLLC